MNRSFSKIRHIQESNLKLEKRLISEQMSVEKEQGDASECAKNYVNLAFEPSVLEPNQETGEGFNVVAGGDLYYWNKNKLPTRGDNEAYDRFIKYVKSVDYLFDDEECAGIKFEDMEPFLKKLYYDKIDKSRMDSKVSPLEFSMRRRNNEIINLIDNHINDIKKESHTFEDPYDFAERVIDWTIEDLMNTTGFSESYSEDEIINNLKDNYTEYILSRYEGDNDNDGSFRLDY
jgi:hypothetical protein